MKVIRPISAVLLAILVLMSSTSFMLGMHICMGEVQNIALFGKAESCQKEKALPACHKHMKPACCEDETVYHDGNDFKASAGHIHFDIPSPVAIEQPVLLIAEIIPAGPVSSVLRHKYDPPFRACDLMVEHHVFLI